MIANARARHDSADLRRLAELGINPLEWRNPPARASRVVIIASDETANTTLKDIMKGLAIAGVSVRLRGGDASTATSADAVVIRFGTVDTAASLDGGTTIVLPTFINLRGNAAAKHQAWSQLRALLRR